MMTTPRIVFEMSCLVLRSLSAVALVLVPLVLDAQGSPGVVPSQVSLDTTFAVRPEARLRLELAAGRIDVKAWDREAVRLVATHRADIRTYINVAPASVAVWATAGKGRFAEIEYTLTVPRRMALALGYGDVDISVSGSEGEIVARNYTGTITIDGGRGTVSATSTLGEVRIANARGRVNAQSTEKPVWLTDIAGEVEVESSSSHLYLVRIDATSVRAVTVGGVIQFSGPVKGTGTYTFISHGGSILLTLPDPLNATVSVATVRGGFGSEFPYTIREQRRRGIFTAVVGDGNATLQLESFAGGINLKREPRRP